MPRRLDLLTGRCKFNGLVNLSTGMPIRISAPNNTGIFTRAISAKINGKSAKLTGPAEQRL